MAILGQVHTAENIPTFDSDQSNLSLGGLFYECSTVHGRDFGKLSF
jgi:hypothetical protein